MKIIVILLMLGAGQGIVFAQNAAQATAPRQSMLVELGINSESGSRFPLLTREDMPNEDSKLIYDQLAGPDGSSPRGEIATALYSPKTAAVFARMLQYLRTESGLGDRLFELLSLITAREMNLRYEWSQHEARALQAGLEPAVIEVIRMSDALTGLSDHDTLVIDFGRQLFRNRHVEPNTFAALLEWQGRKGSFDVIMALTYHTMAGILQRAVDQQPPEGWNSASLPAVAGVGTPIGQPGEFIALEARPPRPADVYEDSYYRLPLLLREELTLQDREIFDQFIGADQTAAPRGPVGMTLNSPALVEPIQQLNNLLRVNGVLNRRTAEIIITTTGREMNSQYQWVVHGAAARQADAGQQVMDAIGNDGRLSGLDQQDAVVIAFTRQLFRAEKVDSETFAAAVELFGTQGTVEIAGLIGDYLMMTMMYNALGMRLRLDQDPTLPHRTGAPVGAEWR